MKNKKTIIVFGIVTGTILIAVAAFIGGRLLNQRLSPVSLLQGEGNAGQTTSAIEVIRSPELPATFPDVIGTYIERQDNVLNIQPFPLDMGGGGVVDPSSDVDVSSQVEVVVNHDTLIYADVTYVEETATKVQQAIQPIKLDDLRPDTMVSIWGRKVGDRMIAAVLVIYDPALIEVP